MYHLGKGIGQRATTLLCMQMRMIIMIDNTQHSTHGRDSFDGFRPTKPIEACK